jgi:hypothetical protein
MAQKRLYKVTVTAHGKATDRLIHAPNAAQAIRKAVEETITCEVPDTMEVARLVANGIKVEDVA